MLRRTLVAAALAAALSVPLAAQEAKPWIHVQVIEAEDDGATIRVNLPLALAQVALDLVPKKFMEKGHLKLEEHGITILDLRRLWQEVKASGDAEFVSVESEKQNVTVSRAGDVIQIRVQDVKEGKTENVRVDIPIRVVDALLSGEGEELDLAAAVNQLGSERGEIVSVEDGETRVRVWIDDKRG